MGESINSATCMAVYNFMPLAGILFVLKLIESVVIGIICGALFSDVEKVV